MRNTRLYPGFWSRVLRRWMGRRGVQRVVEGVWDKEGGELVRFLIVLLMSIYFRRVARG